MARVSESMRVEDRLMKLLGKRGWRLRRKLSRLLIVDRRGYVVVFIPVEGRRRAFVSREVVKRAMAVRNGLRRSGERADAVVAARVGRKWHFVLLTEVKSVKLDARSLSNWSP